MSLDVFEIAREHPHSLALVSGRSRLTFAELASAVGTCASVLGARGLLTASTAPVALVARPGLQTLIPLYALWSYGVPVFPLPARLPAAQRQAWAARANARALLDPAELGDPPSASSPPPLPTPVHPSAPFAIVATSGSSGTPKLVELSRAAFVASARASAQNLPLSEQDRWLSCLPLSHIGGLSILTRGLASRSAVVSFDPGSVGLLRALPALAECLTREQVTVVSLVPTLLQALLALEPRWFPSPSLRAVLLGGAATSAALLARAKERGVPVLTTYGLTEACSQVTTTLFSGWPEVESGLVSSGRPLHGIELRIDASQRICVRGPTLCSRFIDGERPLDADGFLRTEDRGYLNSAGELFVLGRVSELIVTGGENVDPLRVEAALLGIDGVAGAVVFGVPDERFGERVACALVLGSGAQLTSVRAQLQELLAPWERPRLVTPIDTLPLLENGKIDRQRSRALAEGALVPWLDRKL